MLDSEEGSGMVMVTHLSKLLVWNEDWRQATLSTPPSSASSQLCDLGQVPSPPDTYFLLCKVIVLVSVSKDFFEDYLK